MKLSKSLGAAGAATLLFPSLVFAQTGFDGLTNVSPGTGQNPLVSASGSLKPAASNDLPCAERQNIGPNVKVRTGVQSPLIANNPKTLNWVGYDKVGSATEVTGSTNGAVVTMPASTWSGRIVSLNGIEGTFLADDGTTYRLDLRDVNTKNLDGSARAGNALSVNERVQVRGVLSDGSIRPEWFRDFSLSSQAVPVRGILHAVNGDTSFTVRGGPQGLQRVYMADSTCYYREGQVAQAADLTVGSVVVVSATWDVSSRNLTARSVQIFPRSTALRDAGSISEVLSQPLVVNSGDGGIYSIDVPQLGVVVRNGVNGQSESETALDMNGDLTKDAMTDREGWMRDLSSGTDVLVGSGSAFNAEVIPGGNGTVTANSSSNGSLHPFVVSY